MLFVFDRIGVRHLGILASAGPSVGLKHIGNSGSGSPFDFRSAGSSTTHAHDSCRAYVADACGQSGRGDGLYLPSDI